jgi:hypothetical protein
VVGKARRNRPARGGKRERHEAGPFSRMQLTLGVAAAVVALVTGLLTLPPTARSVWSEFFPGTKLDLVIGAISVRTGVPAVDALNASDIACKEATRASQPGIEAAVSTTLTGTSGAAMSVEIALKNSREQTVSRCSHDLEAAGPTTTGTLVYWFPKPQRPGRYHIDLKATLPGHPDVLAPRRESADFTVS